MNKEMVSLARRVLMEVLATLHTEHSRCLGLPAVNAEDMNALTLSFNDLQKAVNRLGKLRG